MLDKLSYEARLAIVEHEIHILKETNEKILEELQRLNASLTSYKGFIGGVLFIVGSIWAILLFFQEKIIKIFN